MEEDINEMIAAAVVQAKADPEPSLEELMTDTYIDNSKHFIRGKLIEESQFTLEQRR